jgi:BirA family biotin operon repressor/biotin-[acetyl-CoA-carboxylase] ligase
VSPPGNLHASLLLVDPCEPARAHQLGFVAGLALHDAVRRTAFLDAPLLALKWPNDLLVGPAKAAGILVEGHRLAEGAFAVVIGIGADVAHAPEGLAYPTAALGAHAPGLDAGTLFSALAGAFAERHAQWAAGEGFEALRGDWLARAAGLGRIVTLRTPAAERSGRLLGLDPTGRLRLQTPSGVELVDAGDLSFSDTNRKPNPAGEPTRMTI